MRPTPEILRLAYRDFAHERRISLCFVLALMAVLAPLLILFGLKFGLVDTLAQRLVQSPTNREVQPVGSREYEQAWFDRIGARADVAFLIPNTRRIAASLSRVLNPATGHDLRVLSMIPSGAGDPLLAEGMKAPTGLAELVLSASAARKLGAQPGDHLVARIDRRREGRDENAVWEVVVTGVLPEGALGEEAALVPLALLVATEDYRDGSAVPALGWEGAAPRTGPRRFARFRLYAASIYAVAGLAADLAADGVEVRTAAVEIAAMQGLDRNLSRVFWLIALIGSLGFLASLAANLLANVERKRRELAVVRLIGFPTRSLILFPVAQAVLVALLGAATALLAYLPVAVALNSWFADSLRPGESICRLLPSHLLLALTATLLGAAAAAAWAGWRAARIAPAEGLRDI
ncbi:FtsX-like permease family protein [uncultured Thiodictyon sp.]|uniref:FtsX-like permease family protein n=1 Tax=uncultured Thiodictyon sp. TaxID=1846217 RepID=UPI0025F6FD90|nr:FtsX-like permease family protein [uncultured Thiodictyon sp.]